MPFRVFITTLLLSFVFVLLSLFTLRAQQVLPQGEDLGGAYWQQEVNYKINVTLDDRKNKLSGDIEIEYINHSPDALSFIWFHLWMNAYKNTNTAFAKQQVENGNTEFFFSKPEDKGRIDQLDFKVNGEAAQLIYDSVNIDIAKLVLNKPLASGDRITVTTPFHVKLPYTFSRGGHVGQTYQISQWYPKPAVYDKDGWHPMPYLDQGEFYSEYGSYDVHITLPGNYIVGATGDLQNEDELKWYEQKSVTTKQKFGLEMSEEEKQLAKEITPKDSAMKTLHYTQQRVHDFAWFADKKFNVLKGDVTLPNSDNHVTTWLMFLDKNAALWKNAQPYIDSSIYYYSKWMGDYPYKQATAVEGALSAGAGMEYPNVTIIGDTKTAMMLETAIAHEVGHNWLYGILGFNERLYPWMDEGINSYYEERYIDTRHPEKMFVPGSGVTKFFDLNHYPHRFTKYFTYLFQERRHEDQAVDLPSTEFTGLNYGAIVYSKTPLLFIHLAASLGQERFDSVMQQFYEEWKFKHPQPADFQKTFETETRVDLDWLFDQSMKTTQHLDYKIVSAKDTMHIVNSVYQKIKIRNVGGIRAPYSISALKDNKVVKTMWYGGFTGKLDVLFPKGDYDKFRIDDSQEMWESNRKNNTIRTHGLFRKTEPLRIQFLGSLENPNRNQLFFSPAGGWNNYNGGMLGLAFYNSFLPSRNVEYQLVPMWGFGSNTFAGIGRVAFHFYPDGDIFREIIFNVTGSQFSYDSLEYQGNYNFMSYSRLSGRLDFNLKNKLTRSKVEKGFTLRSILIRKELPIIFTDQNNYFHSFENYADDNFYTTFSFHFKNSRIINPFSFSFSIENRNHLDDPAFPLSNYSDSFTKLYIEGNYFINYNSNKSGLSIRIFGGTFLTKRAFGQGFHLSATTGVNDYLYDEVFFARSEREGFFSQQFMMTEGGMKYRTDFQTNPLGSSDAIASLNLKSSFPLKLPLFVFADLGYFNKDGDVLLNTNNYVQYDAGVGVEIIQDVCEVYLPLLFSEDIDKNINTIPAYNKWYKRILFTFNLSKLNPFDQVRHFQQ